MSSSKITLGFYVALFSLVAVLVTDQRLDAQGFSISCGESQVTIEHDGKLVSTTAQF